MVAVVEQRFHQTQLAQTAVQAAEAVAVLRPQVARQQAVKATMVVLGQAAVRVQAAVAVVLRPVVQMQQAQLLVQVVMVRLHLLQVHQ
jgi:hypothetical protein